MAHITLSGTLLDPTSEFAVGDQVRFTHKSTTGDTICGAVSLLTVPPNGQYSIDLQYGLVLVEYQDVRTNSFKNLGVATVNSTNPATSIPELLNALVPVSSPELIEFQQILADCITAENNAEASASAALVSETNAANSAASIDEENLTFNYDTVAEYKADTTLWPVGKRIYILERDAYFSVIAGTGTGTGFKIIASTSVNQSISISEGQARSKAYGAIGDDVADDSVPIQLIFTEGGLVNDGTYKITSKLNLAISSVVSGESTTGTILKSYVTGGELLHVNGDVEAGNEYNKLTDLTLLSSFGKLSVTDEVAIKHGDTYSVVFAEYNNIVIDGFSKSGFENTRGWNVVFNLCYFIRCGDQTKQRAGYGAVNFDQTGSGTVGWAGSGFTFNNTTFIGVEYGIYNNGAWNVECNNCIFENVNTPYYKAPQGSLMTINYCWFEDATNQAVIEGTVMVTGGRSPKTSGQNPSSGLDFDGISGSFGIVMYQDAEVITNYTDGTGTPSGSVEFTSSGLLVTGNITPKSDNTYSVGSSSNKLAEVHSEKVFIGAATNRGWFSGSGSPEGSVTAGAGSIYTDNLGGAGTTLYVKESGTGNAGWAAK